MNSAVTAWLKPRRPSLQMTTNAAKARTTAIAARHSAPPKVATAGMISRRSSQPMMMEMRATGSENSATRRAQTASRDIGSSAKRRRCIAISAHRADLLERRPSGRVEQRGTRSRHGARRDGDDAVLGLRMVGEQFYAGFDGTGDALQDGAERPAVAADLGHETDAETVRRPLDLARIGRSQHRARRDDHRAAAD